MRFLSFVMVFFLGLDASPALGQFGLFDGDDTKIKGPTGTEIGNVSDRLKVDSSVSTADAIVPHVTRTDVSTTLTASTTSSSFDTAGFGLITTQYNVSAISGTSASLQIDIETSEDQTNWDTLVSNMRVTTATSTRQSGISIGARYYRFRYFVEGTTPSVTFTVITTLKHYYAPDVKSLFRYSDLNLAVVNSNSTTFKAGTAANVALQLFRAADGGSGSNIRVQVSNDNLNWTDITGDIGLTAGENYTQQFSGYAFRFWRCRVRSATNAGTRVADIFWHANGGS